MAAPAAAARAGHARSRSKAKPARRRSGAAAKSRAGAKARTGGATRVLPRGATVSRSGAVALPRPGVARPRKKAAARTAPRQGTFVPVLDRVLRGPGYIALVGVLLTGIVFFNVDVLQVNHGIAKTGARADALKRQNAVLTRELAKLASSERIQVAAVAQGLVLPPPGDVRYLKFRGEDSRRALRTMTAPAPVEAVTPPPAPEPAAPAPPVETAPMVEAAPAPIDAQAAPQAQTAPQPQPQPTPTTQPAAVAPAGGTQATG